MLFTDTMFTKLTKLELFFIKKKFLFLLLASSTLNFKRGEEENGLNTVQSTQGCQDAKLAKCQVYDLPWSQATTLTSWRPHNWETTKKNWADIKRLPKGEGTVAQRLLLQDAGLFKHCSTSPAPPPSIYSASVSLRSDAPRNASPRWYDYLPSYARRSFPLLQRWKTSN